MRQLLGPSSPCIATPIMISTTMERKINPPQKNPKVGDILEDTVGNKMVVVDVLPERSGECYVLLNGRIKLVNAQGPFIIKSHKKEKLNSYFNRRMQDGE